MMWACVVLGAGDESSPRAFVEFGEHPAGQRLKGPANAVLTGKRHRQPGGKQGAENERGGHGKGLHGGESVYQFRQASSAISTATHRSWAKS